MLGLRALEQMRIGWAHWGSGANKDVGPQVEDAWVQACS